MKVIRGKIEATVTLSKSTCYFMKTGKCSLHMVGDHYISSGGKLAANDLFYCPRLYRSMLSKEGKPLTIIPCECGHAEVVSGHQRACIAAQQRLAVPVQAAPGEAERAFCSVCDGQVTFETQNNGGIRIVTVKAVIQTDDEPETADESDT